jgi:hypothetical protein
MAKAAGGDSCWNLFRCILSDQVETRTGPSRRRSDEAQRRIPHKRRDENDMRVHNLHSRPLPQRARKHFFAGPVLAVDLK